LLDQVLRPRCARCHEPGEEPDFFTAAGLERNFELVAERVLIKRDMPPRRPLPEEEQREFLRWIALQGRSAR
jgi:hypothetical protein